MAFYSDYLITISFYFLGQIQEPSIKLKHENPTTPTIESNEIAINESKTTPRITISAIVAFAQPLYPSVLIYSVLALSF